MMLSHRIARQWNLILILCRNTDCEAVVLFFQHVQSDTIIWRRTRTKRPTTRSPR